MADPKSKIKIVGVQTQQPLLGLPNSGVEPHVQLPEPGYQSIFFGEDGLLYKIKNNNGSMDITCLEHKPLFAQVNRTSAYPLNVSVDTNTESLISKDLAFNDVDRNGNFQFNNGHLVLTNPPANTIFKVEFEMSAYDPAMHNVGYNPHLGINLNAGVNTHLDILRQGRYDAKGYMNVAMSGYIQSTSNRDTIMLTATAILITSDLKFHTMNLNKFDMILSLTQLT